MPTFDGVDDFVWIGDPLEGFGVGIVIVEEAIDRGLQVGDGSEDATLEATLAQGREEALDGIEPRGRSGGEVECPAGMTRQPFADLGMLVDGIVVEDRMDDGLTGGNGALDSIEEADELLMPMALHIAADHGSVEDVHRRKQRRRSMAFVVVGHRSGPAFLHRQARLGSVERLDLTLLIDRKDDGVGRRIDIGPDHIAQLLEPMGAPDALDGRDADAGRVRHRRARPVRGFGQRRLHRQRHDALGDSGIEFRDARRPRLIAQQPFETLGGEAFLPALYTGLGLPSPVHDRVRARPFAVQQHDPRAPNMLLWSVPISNQRTKPIKIGREDGKGDAASHSPNSHAANQPGIPKGIQMLDLIHSHVRRFK
jgi:hypothetical protein